MQRSGSRYPVDNRYYAFSGVLLYADVKGALLLNGRVNNLEYGSCAPRALQVFISDQDFRTLWAQPERTYLLVETPAVERIRSLAGADALHLVKGSRGKFLFVNQQP